MPSGVTNRMRNIRRTIPQERFDATDGPNRGQRRHGRTTTTGLLVRGKARQIGGRFMPKDLQDPTGNTPYVNPARDLRKGRRLRRELRLP